MELCQFLEAEELHASVSILYRYVRDQHTLGLRWYEVLYVLLAFRGSYASIYKLQPLGQA